MNMIELGEGYSVVCEWKKTRMAFKHEATLFHNGNQICFKKVCYQNRTWEAYTYQTVIREVIYKCFTDKYQKNLADRLMAAADAIGKGEAERAFAPVKMVAAFGDLLCDTPGDKAAWKKKMLSTVPGINFPSDFDELSDEERNKRLDGALGTL